jgi:hypothetical protein
VGTPVDGNLRSDSALPALPHSRRGSIEMPVQTLQLWHPVLYAPGHAAL